MTLNAYLNAPIRMDHVRMVLRKMGTNKVRTFATSAARDAAIPSPVEGYVIDNDAVGMEIYRDGAWASVASGVGGALNVKSYGAIGDNTTDDTVAIQAALDAAGAGARPLTVEFPIGRYRVTDTLHLPHHVSMRGQGHGFRLADEAPVVIYHDPDTPNTDLFTYDYDLDGRAYREGGLYQGLMFHGNSDTRYFFNLDTVSYVTFRDCYSLGLSTLDQPTAHFRIVDSMFVTWERCKFANASAALILVQRTGLSSTQNHLYNCYMTGTTTPWAIDVEANAFGGFHLIAGEIESVIGGIRLSTNGNVQAFAFPILSVSGSGLTMTGGASATFYNGGPTPGTTSIDATSSLKQWPYRQGDPAVIVDGDTAITVADLRAGILTMASSTSGRAPTVPTGTDVDTALPYDGTLEWTFINTGDQTVTITAAAGHTLVGSMAIAAGSQKGFLTKNTQTASTAITYSLTP